MLQIFVFNIESAATFVKVLYNGCHNFPSILTTVHNHISSMASKPITIRWIRTGSQPDWKIMYSIELHQTNIKIKIIKLKPVLSANVLGPSGLTKLVLIL